MFLYLVSHTYRALCKVTFVLHVGILPDSVLKNPSQSCSVAVLCFYVRRGICTAFVFTHMSICRLCFPAAYGVSCEVLVACSLFLRLLQHISIVNACERKRKLFPSPMLFPTFTLSSQTSWHPSPTLGSAPAALTEKDTREASFPPKPVLAGRWRKTKPRWDF